MIPLGSQCVMKNTLLRRQWGPLSTWQILPGHDRQTCVPVPSFDIHVGEFIESLDDYDISGTMLKSIRFDPQNKVTTINEGDLSTHTVLTELVFSLGLTHIPSLMCGSCEILDTLTIPDQVKTIGYRVSTNVPGLQSHDHRGQCL
jgi:hypothetical protein